MEPRDIFEAWAPEGGAWSPWVKPVLFAHLPVAFRGPAPPPSEIHGDPILVPSGATDTAIVIDLPGVESIAAGLDLVRLGFRPVPLFNGCPATMIQGRAYDEVVPTGPLIAALADGTKRLATTPLPLDAPPAFLLDADRMSSKRRDLRPEFDNRWVVFTTDFPSASLLKDRGITAVLVVHNGRLGDDLVDVLRLWQQDGITLTHDDLARSSEPQPLTLPSRWWTNLARAARRLWYAMSLWRNHDGGFGGLLLEGTAAGG